MELDRADALIANALATDTLANGYLVVGDLKSGCLELANRILRRLFPNELEQIERKCHPDVIWLEPEGKSRTIHAESMRERMIAPMGLSAYSGGWKVGVIAGADRLETVAANAFLKSLEEPTPKTLYLLLTDAPDMLLPTIVSRLQRLDLPLSAGLLEGDDYAAVAAIFGEGKPATLVARADVGYRLAAILGELKDAAEAEDVALVRKAFYKTVMHFVRQWMVEGRVPRHLAFRNVDAVEDAYRQSEKSMQDEMVLTMMTDRMTWP